MIIISTWDMFVPCVVVSGTLCGRWVVHMGVHGQTTNLRRKSAANQSHGRNHHAGDH